MKDTNNREKLLQNHLNILHFLKDSADEVLYLCDLADEKIYFIGDIKKKYHIPLEKDGVYRLEQLQEFIHGRSDAPVFFNPQAFMKNPDGILHQEYCITDSEGSKFRIRSHEKLYYDDNGFPLYIVGRFSEAVMEQESDSLTGLYNEKIMLKTIEQCIECHENGFLMVLGIDNFMNINNRYGRGFGNHVLKKVAEVLREFQESQIHIYRLGSDKFAINAVGRCRKDIEELYFEIQSKVSELCTLSSGAADYGNDLDETVDAVYQRAENALDHAKKNGKNMQSFFSEAIYREQQANIRFEEELRSKIADDFNGFYICYQPQIDAGTFRIYGAEALLRYNSPERGMVPPTEFVPILEQTGLISLVGEWVLEQALIQCKIWRAYFPDFHVSVNYSHVQLQDENVSERIIQLLEELELPGNALTLEVTESIQLQDYQFINKIFFALKKRGVEIAIDDFGTGYSSLSYLKSIAIDEVKIDRCFVTGIQHSAYNYRLLVNMIELAHSAKIRVCCEGVETEEELRTIKTLHPDTLQGYLFAKPCSVEEFAARYIQADSKWYKEREEKEQKYLSLKGSEYTEEEWKTAELEKMATIIDGMNEIVYVRDPNTFEVFYLNATGRALTGVYDYKGRKCYEVLQNKQCPCECCDRECADKGAYHIWEMYSDNLQKHFIVKDKMISWSGQEAKLTICLEGYLKDEKDSQIPIFIPLESSIIFVYNPKTQSIYFYNNRGILAGEEMSESEFPNCWIQQGMVHPHFIGQFEELFGDEKELEKVEGEEILLKTKNGEYEWFHLSIRDFGREEPDLDTWIVILEPASEERAAQLRHMRLQDFYKATLSEKIAYMEVDLESRHVLNIGGLWENYKEEVIEKENDYLEVMLRYKELLIHPDDKSAYIQFFGEDFAKGLIGEKNHTKKLRYRRLLDGRMQWMEITVHIFEEQYSENLYALIYLKNIDAEKRRELEQETAATKDPLTELLNRRAFQQQVENHMLETTEDAFGTMILMDIDEFKQVNDNYGHAEGDRVLKQLSDVLMTTFRKKDIIGRLGGDEFIIFLKNVSRREVINRRLEEFREAYAKGNPYQSTCSIGVIEVKKENFSYEEYLKKVDIALYRSKQNGKNCYHYYES